MNLALSSVFFALALVAPAAAQITVFEERFEGPSTGWSTSAQWHLEPDSTLCGSQVAPYPDGSQAMRFGGFNAAWVYCHFQGWQSGQLSTLAPISIPGWAVGARLRFWSFEQTECGFGNCGWDHRSVFASINGGQSWTLLWEGAEENAWLERVVDLSAYAGEDVLLRFQFDPIDEWLNDYLGWFVDDVRVEVDPPAPTAYCTAKVNSQGCTPALSSTGTLWLSGPDDFHVTASEILNNVASKLVWSRSPNAAPFHGGTLCVLPPAARTSVHSSGGTPPPGTNCSGSYDWHFSHAYLASKAVLAGETLHIQFSGRDPGFAPPGNHSLSAGLQVTVLP
jgi:hypothetical protein